jgi:ribulose-5-phosphate 4-epimerase/fuculose-1-phosphate aldolase
MKITPVKEPAMRDRVSAEEWAVRVDLAALFRLIDVYGMTDFIYNHTVARRPGFPTQYLTNGYGWMFEEICASNLVAVDFSGEIVLAPPENASYHGAAHDLEAAVLEARPDLNCVAHVHTPAALAIASMTCGLLPITQTAMNLHGRIAVNAYTFGEGCREQIMKDVAEVGKDIVILRNHGVLACGRTIPEAFINLWNFEFAAKAQLLAMAGEKHIAAPAADVIKKTTDGFAMWFDRKGGPRDTRNCIEWSAALRMLDRRDASYRN